MLPSLSDLFLQAAGVKGLPTCCRFHVLVHVLPMPRCTAGISVKYVWHLSGPRPSQVLSEDFPIIPVQTLVTCC